MNRLILLGNGFDLAHGLKTGYNNFIIWYISNCFENVKDNYYEDELLSVQANSYTYVQNELNGKSIKEYIFQHYENGTLDEFMELSKDYFPDIIFSDDSYKRPYHWTSAFEVQVKSQLLKEMITNCKIDKWVDIENLFYSSLKEALAEKNPNKDKEVNELNKSLSFIIKELQVYLKNLGKSTENIDLFRLLINEQIEWSEIVERAPLADVDLKFKLPEKTLILNFNYTNTVEQYLSKNSNVEINYIHGKLDSPNNPVIFGFGDELDQEYAKFELDRTKEIFKYIKSFWYFKTSNYHNLLRFIQSNPFQVFILGHSCGLSDRTMLNMIFEHDNCLSIKIYYYQNPSTGKNNYTELTEEISRHFKDKRQMRLKIVPFDKSSFMPQLSPF